MKRRTYYFFNGVIDINFCWHCYCYYIDIVIDFDLNNVKIDEKAYKNILIYYVVYMTIKDYLKYL